MMHSDPSAAWSFFRIIASSAAAFCVLVVAPAEAQQPCGAHFCESFDDTGAQRSEVPPALAARGWVFRNQSYGNFWANPESWWQQSPDPSSYLLNFPPKEVSGFLGLEVEYGGVGIERVVRWMILPDLADISGKELSFWLTSGPNNIWELTEIRYSPSGGISTGTLWSDVGDFTDLLFSRTFASSSWELVGATIPGNGRLAIRFFEEKPRGVGIDSVAIDDLQISDGGALPPLPGFNQTERWTAAMSPIVIDAEWIIPSTGTVLVDPGVEVVFQGSGAVLRVRGALRAMGTAEGPVRFRDAGSAQQRIVVGYIDSGSPGPLPHATCELEWSLCEVGIRVFEGGAFAARDSRFENLPFAGSHAITATHSTLALRDSSFTQHGIKMFAPEEDNYLLLDGCTFDNAPVIHSRRVLSSTTFVDDCVFKNVTTPGPYYVEGAPFIISGGNDVFFGAGNIFTNNIYPVHIYTGGGIAPGSTIPASGNLNAYVLVEAMGGLSGRNSAARLAVPYLCDGAGGFLDVEPGAVFHMVDGVPTLPNQADPHHGRWHGTPDAPIVLETAPGHSGIWWMYSHASSVVRMSNLLVRGADYGIRGDQSRVQVLDCVVEDCGNGIGGGQFNAAHVERTMILDSDLALYSVAGSPTSGIGRGNMYAGFPHNPNWIEGNAMGAEAFDDASNFDVRFNWWGHPSGPQHPQNPGGQGDPVDPGIEDIFPFLTAPPDFDDHPPVVRIEPASLFAQAGDKVLLHWKAEDDGQIVAQRLEYAAYAGTPLSTFQPDLHPSARSVEVIVPAQPPSNLLSPSLWRVVAIDDRGQEGWYEVEITLVQRAGTLDFGPQIEDGSVVTVGEQFDLTWTPHAAGEVHILLEGIPTPKPQTRIGYQTASPMPALFNDIPPVSTDMARYGIYDRDEWQLGEEIFAIRPHPLAGDAPPTVTLLSPAGGGSFAGGEVVPVAWSAADDESIRSFDLQASYDGGFFWHFIERGLPASTTSYDWQLPTSSGIDDVRLRVIARDLRFQASSATVQLSLLPGTYVPPSGAIDHETTPLPRPAQGIARGR